MFANLGHRLAGAAFQWQQAIGATDDLSALFNEPPKRPSASQVQALAVRCRSILADNLASFFLGSLDRAHRGYLEDAHKDGFFDRGEKSLLMQTRQLWFFSLLVRENIRADESMTAAQHGFDFLEEHFRDRVYGGYQNKVRTDGKLLDSVKLVRHQSFALFALSGFAMASDSQAASDSAQALFKALESHAYDTHNGGYIDCCRADWSVIGTDQIDPNETRRGARSLESDIHIIEAFTEFYRLNPDDHLRRRIEELLLRCLLAFRHPHVPAMINYWWVDNDQPVEDRYNLRARYGHDLELIWFLLDSARCIGVRVEPLRTWAEQFCAYSLRHGYDFKYGGFYNVGSFGGVDETIFNREKVWWIQAEAMVTMLEMYRLTDNPLYFAVFLQTFTFVQDHFVAPDGGWWRRVYRRGGLKKPNVKASATQGGYHSGRAMARCAGLLDAIAADISAKNPKVI